MIGDPHFLFHALPVFLSTIISSVYIDKWWFDESMSVTFCIFFQLNMISQMALTQYNYVQKKCYSFTEFLGFGARLEKWWFFPLSRCDIHEN